MQNWPLWTEGARWAAAPKSLIAYRPVVEVPATDPLYVLYRHVVALARGMTNIYDVGPGDMQWTASEAGWMVGHSYVVCAPLLAGATTVVYEGKPVGTPDASDHWAHEKLGVPVIDHW